MKNFREKLEWWIMYIITSIFCMIIIILFLKLEYWIDQMLNLN